VSAMILLSIGLLACRPDPDKATSEDSGITEEARPWLEWEAVPLTGLHPLLDVSLPQSVDPTHIETLPERSLSVVWDPGAAQAWVIDARYRHDPSSRCVSAAAWPDWGDAARRGSCPEGLVSTQRGALSLPAGLRHVAVDPDGLRLALLDEDGRLWLAAADPLEGNPLDFLRPIDADLDPIPGASRLSFADDGTLLVARGSDLLHIDLDAGTPATEVSLPSPALSALSLGGVSWVVTAEGLLRDGVLLEGTTGIASLIADPVGEGVAYTDLDVGAVVRLDRDGVVRSEPSVAGLLGPLAAALDGSRLYAVTADGIAVAGEDVVYAGDFVDVAVGPAHEVLALGAASVTVLGDEDLLAVSSEPPVALMVAAFIEKPRSPDVDAPCRGDGSVTTFATRAGESAAVLADLPAAVALGLTPHFARRAVECEITAPLAPLLGLERAELGVLFHEQHDCDVDDVDCAASFLASEAEAVSALGEVTFTSGLATQDGDWVAALEAAGLPDRYVFFGASILPSIEAEGDPRAKDSWPLTERSGLWRAESTADIVGRSGGGWLVVQPGDNLPAFNLSACGNLFLRECHVAGGGDGVSLDIGDTAVLVVLARRAVAERQGPSAWSFHLPDLGVYDYTTGCARDDGGLWSGESCGAARLQEWAEVMHTRYVLSGLARWAAPTDVEAP
jgi:hypothetical protein